MGQRELPRHLRVDAPSVAVMQMTLFGSAGRVYARYDQWEDYRAGMFDSDAPEAIVKAARALLSVPCDLRTAMFRTVEAWPISAAVNLTNGGCNRRAWLGQAACCFTLQATATATKRAWWQLSDGRRTDANAVADEVVSLWKPTHCTV